MRTPSAHLAFQIAAGFAEIAQPHRIRINAVQVEADWVTKGYAPANTDYPATVASVQEQGGRAVITP